MKAEQEEARNSRYTPAVAEKELLLETGESPPGGAAGSINLWAAWSPLHPPPGVPMVHTRMS